MAYLIDKYPAQISLLMLQRLWTEDVAASIIAKSTKGANKAAAGEATRKKIEAGKNCLVKYTTSPETDRGKARSARPYRVIT